MTRPCRGALLALPLLLTCCAPARPANVAPREAALALKQMDPAFLARRGTGAIAGLVLVRAIVENRSSSARAGAMTCLRQGSRAAPIQTQVSVPARASSRIIVGRAPTEPRAYRLQCRLEGADGQAAPVEVEVPASAPSP